LQSLHLNSIKKTYLEKLKNKGLIDEFESEIDKRKKGYYPIIDITQFVSPTDLNEKNKITRI